MQYGLIGEKLYYSFSSEIHAKIGDYGYSLCEIERKNLEDFFKKREFRGVNVTLPYKSECIKYLDTLSDAAAKTGAVNTVVNKDGRLFGYNTDTLGLFAAIKQADIELCGKKVLILGSGATSKTALYVANKAGAKSAVRLSRTAKDGALLYENADKTAEVIINTTPCGTSGFCEMPPICLSDFKRAEAVIDVVYNPLNTPLLQTAKEMGKKTVNGLYMLCFQAVKAAELFGIEVNINPDDLYREILKEKQNIVLIGMPSSGKTTVGKELSRLLNRPFFDTDELILKRFKKTASELITECGEEVMRQKEALVVNEISKTSGAVISTGGGAVLLKENVRKLKENGMLVLLKRDLNLLSDSNRPLFKNKEETYKKRAPVYLAAADVIIENSGRVNDTANAIVKEFLK